MFKVIWTAALLIAGLLAYELYENNYTATVYGCSEEKLPVDVQKQCKRLVKRTQ